MPDKATISHRGEKYEIGRGRRFYGIWVIGAPYDAPVDRWPETRDGWVQAWARFVAIEEPGTITAVQRQRSGLSARAARIARPVAARAAGARRRPAGALLVAEGLLVLGVVLGLAGLFPGYFGGQSLLSQGYLVVAHLCYVVAWAVSAGLVALGAARPPAARLGALFGLGVGAVTFGLFLADLGEVTSGNTSLGTGLLVSMIGWAACTAGSGIAVAATRRVAPQAAGPATMPVAPPVAMPARGGPGRPGRAHAGAFALLVLAGIGTAVTFLPSWDSYTLTWATTGATQAITAGNAFDNPGMVIAGDVLVLVGVIAVAALAALWRPARQGAVLLAGAVVPLAAQAVSALVQASQPATPGMFGISRAQAVAGRLAITSGVTPIFWVYCVFVISLLISCAWLFTEPGQQAMPTWATPWSPPGAEPVNAEAGDEGEAEERSGAEERSEAEAAPGMANDRMTNDGMTNDGMTNDTAGEPADSDGDAEGGTHSAYA